jgi:hypothetical protein
MPVKMRISHPLPARRNPWFLVLLAVLIAASPALPAHAQEAIARLLDLQGSVEVRRSGESTWSPAQAGSALNPGDTLRTQGRSQATILRPDGTTLELFPLSEATIEDEKAVMLLLGKIWSQFQKAIGRPHEIRTPSSVALIRGTVLTVETESTGASHVAVVEGLVEVVDRQGARREMVGAGFAVRADREGQLQRMERARPDTLDEGRGFMDRVERGRQLRQREDVPGRDSHRLPGERGPHDPARESRRDDRPERERAHERIEGRGAAAEHRIEQKLRLEERLERGAGERLERLIDRTQRDERRELAEQRREERQEKRREERTEQENNRLDAEQRENLLERLRDRLKRGL